MCVCCATLYQLLVAPLAVFCYALVSWWQKNITATVAESRVRVSIVPCLGLLIVGW